MIIFYICQTWPLLLLHQSHPLVSEPVRGGGGSLSQAVPSLPHSVEIKAVCLCISEKHLHTCICPYIHCPVSFSLHGSCCTHVTSSLSNLTQSKVSVKSYLCVHKHSHTQTDLSKTRGLVRPAIAQYYKARQITLFSGLVQGFIA